MDYDFSVVFLRFHWISPNKTTTTLKLAKNSFFAPVTLCPTTHSRIQLSTLRVVGSLDLFGSRHHVRTDLDLGSCQLDLDLGLESLLWILHLALYLYLGL